MGLAEVAALALVVAGIVMMFTSSFGVGDQESARFMVSSGLILLGAYYYGLYVGYSSRRGVKQGAEPG